MTPLLESLLRGLGKLGVIDGLLYAKPTLTDYPKPVLGEQEGNDAIGVALETGKPLMVARFGANELRIAAFYDHLLQARPGKNYPRIAIDRLCHNAGFFPVPQGREPLDRYARLVISDARELDVLGVWQRNYEHEMVRRHCPEASLVPLRSLEPYFFAEPYSRHFAGKKVLVVHPYAESILKQYREARTKLFPDPLVLPEFELITLKAVQSIGAENNGLTDWFMALDSMKSAMDGQDYDILIVGAGAYGFHLAAHAKRQGKQAIHLGGATQILFGIMGRRWENHPKIAGWVNDAWTRPSRNETPKAAGTVENGCYW